MSLPNGSLLNEQGKIQPQYLPSDVTVTPEEKANIPSAEKQAEWDNKTRSATIKIAAYNATAKSKAAADYVCDGTADDVEINAAIQEIAGIGGCIELSEGIFNLSNTLTLNNNIWIKGQGYASALIGDGTGSYNGISVPSECKCKITDLNITGVNIGIYINSTAIVTITSCSISGNLNTGILNFGTATITLCDCNDNFGVGIDNEGTLTIITNNRCTNNQNGTIINSGVASVVANNVVF